MQHEEVDEHRDNLKKSVLLTDLVPPWKQLVYNWDDFIIHKNFVVICFQF